MVLENISTEELIKEIENRKREQATAHYKTELNHLLKHVEDINGLDKEWDWETNVMTYTFEFGLDAGGE